MSIYDTKQPTKEELLKLSESFKSTYNANFLKGHNTDNLELIERVPVSIIIKVDGKEFELRNLALNGATTIQDIFATGNDYFKKCSEQAPTEKEINKLTEINKEGISFNFKNVNYLIHVYMDEYEIKNTKTGKALSSKSTRYKQILKSFLHNPLSD